MTTLRTVALFCPLSCTRPRNWRCDASFNVVVEFWVDQLSLGSSDEINSLTNGSLNELWITLASGSEKLFTKGAETQLLLTRWPRPSITLKRSKIWDESVDGTTSVGETQQITQIDLRRQISAFIFFGWGKKLHLTLFPNNTSQEFPCAHEPISDASTCSG